MKIKDYKPHIDGLRALAVLPVIFFHAGYSFFQGGYVGVDVFFVISGYLITSLILKDLKLKKFSLSNFYLRRSRRILPALYLITFISIIGSIFLIPNEELNFFSKQSISVVLFISNFFFWRNTGYFDQNSELQPLLHTWSLSVEEQFYIFFPIFLILVWKFLQSKIKFILLVIIFLSFISSQVGGNFKIQNLSNEFPFFQLPFNFFWQAGSANFYLPFGRIWELLIGSLISIYTFKKRFKFSKSDNYLSSVGLILIIISIFAYSENIQYPSIFTVLPVLGTSLIILYSGNSSLTYKILTLKPLVYLGLISFSLYLWHQPLLAFNRIYFGVELSFFHTALIILASLLLSIISWKFIERPFRNKKIISDKKAIISIVVSSIIILFLSVLIYSSKIESAQKKLPIEIINSFNSVDKTNCLDLDYAHLDGKDWYCELGDKSKKIYFAVVGDSHALALKPVFDSVAKNLGKKGLLTGFSGCPGLIGINSVRPDHNIKNCKSLNDKLYRFVEETKIKKVFLVSRWTYYTVGNLGRSNFSLISTGDKLFSNRDVSKTSMIYGIRNTAQKYKNLDVELFFVHQIPEQVYSPKFSYQKSFNFKENTTDLKKLMSFGVDYNDYLKHQKFIFDNINLIKKDFLNLKEIDLSKNFCDKSKCYHGSKNRSYYADKHHLSTFGSSKIEKKIKDLLK